MDEDGEDEVDTTGAVSPPGLGSSPIGATGFGVAVPSGKAGVTVGATVDSPSIEVVMDGSRGILPPI